MNTSALKSLMRLFSLTANLTSLPSLEQSGKKVRAYLSQLTNPEEASSYYNMFEFYFNQIQNPEKSFLKRYSLFSVKAIILTNELLPNLTKEQRIFALVILMEIIEQDETERSYLMDFIYTLSDILAISPHTVAQLQEFVFWHDTSTINNNLMLFASDKDHDFKGKYVPWKHVYGKIYFFSETESKTFFFKLEKFREQLSLNGKPIQENKVYFFGKGDSLRSHKFKAIQYSDVVKSYSLDSTIPVTLTAKGVKYQFPDKKTGIHPFDLEEENGQLVGILGSSGVGKTTFVNLLNGNLKPSEGSIWLNGYDIHTEKEMVKSQIGYVPQDDLLISELTVRQNLTYSARLCYGNLTSGEISRKVEDILQSLGLRHIADLAVGDALNKVISGGQRKRLNIALELLREPALLFIDEPTSGLSSSDSDMVMDLLKSLSLRGKLVFANIHQPSSGIFKMFDKIIILDKGGYMIYYGEPLEAAVFFKEHTNRTNASERECVSCGNVNPEQILQLVEQKKITPEGEISQERLLSPEGWYKNHRVYHAMRTIPEPEKTGLPTSGFSLPSAWKQFKIFTERTFLTKYQDKQYLWVSLLEAPLLALILGYFSRYVAGESGNPNQYIFFENVNLPVFFLMSVIVALFIGLVVSAEQIIQDRPILKREEFLNLSRSGYLNSKVLFLMLLSAIQMVTYLLIANLLLGIRGMTLPFWFLLFTTAFNANLLGLNLSANLKSLIAIYVLIPLLLIPQLLLSGSAIKFDKLPPGMKAEEHVPLIGDVMISRWAYETFMVYQFKNNNFEKHFYEIDREISQASFLLNYLVPETENHIIQIKQHTEDTLLTQEIEFVVNQLYRVSEYLNQEINGDKIRDELMHWTTDSTEAILGKYKSAISKARSSYIRERDRIVSTLQEKLTKDALVELKENNVNQAVTDLVTARDEQKKYTIKSADMIQRSDPVFRAPLDKTGRAHFFAPEKRLGSWAVSTYWFNIMVLWLFNLLLYFLLISNQLSKINTFVTNSIYLIRRKIINFITPY